MSRGQPSAVQGPGEVTGYRAMVASMERHQAYVRDRALAMAGQQSAYEEGLTAKAALTAAKASMTVVVRREDLRATPECAWDLVHHRGLLAKAAALKLGVKVPALLEMLADYRAVAEEQEARMFRASDAAHVYEGSRRGPRL